LILNESDESVKEKYVNRILDLDFEKSNDEIKATIKKNVNSVLFSELLDDLIDEKKPDIDFERKNRIKYEISTGDFSDISELDEIYLPAETYEFRKFERLGIPAAVGSVLFGWLFYTLIGGFFKSEYHAALIGMPIGAWFFVWLFSKAIRHPRVAKTIKWAAVISFTGLTIATVFSNIRGSLFGKNRINFIQWIWAGVITLIVFWMLHIFKPVRVNNSVESRKAAAIQVEQFILYKQKLFSEKLEEILTEEPVENLITRQVHRGAVQANELIPPLFLSSKHIVPSIQQIYTAAETNNAEDALISMKSFLNALQSQGINPVEREDIFPFTEGEKKYFDTFGIIEEGDDVRQLYRAWTDSEGNTLIRGKVRKVRR